MTKQNGPYYDENYLRQGSPTNTTFAETIPRIQATLGTIVLPATGVELAVGIPLQFGDVVANLSFIIGATAAVTPTAGYVALRSPAGALLAQSADFATTARAANTAYTVAMTAAYLVSTPGLYYACISFTAGTIPTAHGMNLGNAVVAGAVITGVPILAQSHGAAVGAVAPATIATPTTVATVPYLIAT